MKAVLNVGDYHRAVAQVAQTSLRSVIDKSDLDELLSSRGKINSQLQAVVDEPTEGCGVRVERVEIKDVSLPEAMKRSTPRQAEVERERRARAVLPGRASPGCRTKCHGRTKCHARTVRVSRQFGHDAGGRPGGCTLPRIGRGG
jgi:hypothetical protein